MTRDYIAEAQRIYDGLHRALDPEIIDVRDHASTLMHLAELGLQIHRAKNDKDLQDILQAAANSQETAVDILEEAAVADGLRKPKVRERIDPEASRRPEDEGGP